MTRHLGVVVSIVGLVSGLALAVGMFATVGAAPCDPTAPVLSDGTREAPGDWGTAWATLAFLAAGCFGVAAWSYRRFVSTSPKKRGVAIGIGIGLAALVVIWIAGAAFWSSQCPS